MHRYFTQIGLKEEASDLRQLEVTAKTQREWEREIGTK
jgi:hypothetical protein